MKVDRSLISTCERAAQEIRLDCIRMGFVTGSNGAHFGGALSMVEIMAALYGGIMQIDPDRVQSPSRDRFILSKGHGAMSFYAALKFRGIISPDELLTFKSNNTVLYGHPSMRREIGIEFSSGSLGLGLSLGVGLALGLERNQNHQPRVFVLLGDGECNEGSVWESAAAASHFKLGNLTAIVDKNGLQYDGSTAEIFDMGRMELIWESFGWSVKVVDGHNVGSLVDALAVRENRPTVVIANTVKGKGISFMENNPTWHHNRLTDDQYRAALSEIG